MHCKTGCFEEVIFHKYHDAESIIELAMPQAPQVKKGIDFISQSSLPRIHLINALHNQ